PLDTIPPIVADTVPQNDEPFYRKSVASKNLLLTPNGDGWNDTLVLTESEQCEDNELYVYNRWGIVVCHQRRYENSWRGEVANSFSMGKGNLLPVGTYYYMLICHGERIAYGFIELSY
ncbi:MAG: gliding motility-associated C-terminal domain-containing protein, partial [Paludibacteraceae bacterium]|nr:gliding motility-associated C-terminal domain-containing protein [Paludibacteraceae bacterium]